MQCRREKSYFAQEKVEYLGYVLSAAGIAKGIKVNDVSRMSAPADVTSLKLLLGLRSSMKNFDRIWQQSPGLCII